MQNAENILFTITMIGYFGAMILYFLFVGVRKEQLAKAAGIMLITITAVRIRDRIFLRSFMDTPPSLPARACPQYRS